MVLNQEGFPLVYSRFRKSNKIYKQGTFSTTDNRIHYYNALYDASDSVDTLSDSVIEDLTAYPAEGNYTAKDFMQRMLTSGELFNDPVQQQIALKLFEKRIRRSYCCIL